MSKKHNLAVAEAINPETGEPDLMGALKFITTKLNEEPDIVKRWAISRTQRCNAVSPQTTWRPTDISG